MKCWCQHLFPHIAAIVEVVQGRVEAAVWDYPACTPKPTFTMKTLMTWSGHADGKMLLPWWLRVLLPALFFHNLLPFPYCPPCGTVASVCGTRLVSLFLFIPLLIQHCHAMVPIWHETPRCKTHVYNTSRCNNRLRDVRSYYSRSPSPWHLPVPSTLKNKK